MSKSNLMLGVNLAGGEFGPKQGAVYGKGYIYPSHGEIDYYAAKGMKVVRLPFEWEHVQASKYGSLSDAEVNRIKDVVHYANGKGMKVVLDLHDFGAGFGSPVGSSKTPNSAFADFWGKMAAKFSHEPNVMFGLMNEPHQQTASEWIKSVNAAISAIREHGANQKVLVPGAYWDNASNWVSSDNDGKIGGGVKDPAKNYAFEVHQYLDSDGSGTHKGVVSQTIGVERLAAATKWAEQTGNKLFLGEFGVASDHTSLTAMDKMLTYMEQHPNAWAGATYWAGGPWWGDYMYSVEPSGGHDKPQMTILGQHA